jgi:hypothetical protein
MLLLVILSCSTLCFENFKLFFTIHIFISASVNIVTKNPYWVSIYVTYTN